MTQKPVRLKSTDVAHKLVEDEQSIHSSDSALQVSEVNRHETSKDFGESFNSNFEGFKNDDGAPRLGKLFLLSLISIVSLAIVQLVGALINIFDTNLALGVMLSALLSALIFEVGKYIFRFVRHKNKLVAQEKLKTRVMKFNNEVSHGEAVSVLYELHSNRRGWSVNAFEEFRSKAVLCQDDSEVIHLYSSAILRGMDAQAKSILVKHASDSALMVALSPFAAVDMMLVMWRNFKLIEDISRVYGLSDIPLSRFKILKQVLKNMMYVGASELVLDASFESLGLSLSSKLSARAAQGVGAGLITLRVGMKSIEYCRPVAFNEQHRISMAEMRAEVITQVKDRLLALGKDK